MHNSGSPNAQFTKSSLTPSRIPAIAVDSAGNGWTLGAKQTLYRLTLPNAVNPFAETITSTLPNDLNLLAVDGSDNIWFTSGKNSALGRFDRNGQLISPANGYTGGGLKYPAQLAIDGSNRVWVANRDGNSISVFNNDGSAITSATGYQPSGQGSPDPSIPIELTGVRSPHGLVIDGSGNVWVTNFVSNSVTEFLGIATPVVTPLNPATLGQRP
jgi:streptogramin lyase